MSPTGAAQKGSAFQVLLSVSQVELEVHYIIYLLQVSYLTSHTCLCYEGSPKHLQAPYPQAGALRDGGLWRGDKRDLKVLLIPRAKNLLLWRIFLSSNQWKCVYQETVFDLDKCFTDVNRAGERDNRRRDKEDWEGRGERALQRTRSEERRWKGQRDPALPCQRAEIRIRTHPGHYRPHQG